MALPLPHRPSPLTLEASLPGSKSLTQRFITLAALAQGVSTLRHPLDAEDPLLLIQAFQKLGVQIQMTSDEWVIQGTGGQWNPVLSPIFMGNNGTGARFLAAILSLGHSPVILDGSNDLRRRPFGPLVKALRTLGAVITSAGTNLPLTLEGGFLGGEITLPGHISSQFASALLLASPFTPKGLDLFLQPPLVSMPYLDMTATLMERHHLEVARHSPTHWKVPGNQTLSGFSADIPVDASAAAFPLAAVAVVGGRVRIPNWPHHSLQGDASFASMLADLGCKSEISSQSILFQGPITRGGDLDLRNTPDLAPAAAAVALHAPGPITLHGVAHLRHKEVDRLEALATILQERGAKVDVGEDRLSITPPSTPRGGLIDPLGDHRLAMAASVMALKTPELALKNPSCVQKSFPKFWTEWFKWLGLPPPPETENSTTNPQT